LINVTEIKDTSFDDLLGLRIQGTAQIYIDIVFIGETHSVQTLLTLLQKLLTA
jgi:hypothetical protein